MASKCDQIIFWKETSKKRRQEKLLVILLSQPQEPGMFDGDRKYIDSTQKVPGDDRPTYLCEDMPGWSQAGG